jgi:hypothetical protein
MNLHPAEGMAILSAGWGPNGVGPYLETLLEQTVEFRCGLGVCKTISNETDVALLGDRNRRPWSLDTEPEEVHITPLEAGKV